MKTELHARVVIYIKIIWNKFGRNAIIVQFKSLNQTLTRMTNKCILIIEQKKISTAIMLHKADI